MRSFVHSVAIIATLSACQPALAGGDVDTWGTVVPPKYTPRVVEQVAPPEPVITYAPVEAPALPKIVEAAPVCDNTAQTYAGRTDLWWQFCYIPPFAKSSENPHADDVSPE